VPTPKVFAAIGLERSTRSGLGPSPTLSERADIFAALGESRNDMQASAEAIAPEITQALALLGHTPGVRLARMSGSGATCFALYGDRREAARAASILKAERPGWWVRPTCLR